MKPTLDHSRGMISNLWREGGRAGGKEKEEEEAAKEKEWGREMGRRSKGEADPGQG